MILFPGVPKEFDCDPGVSKKGRQITCAVVTVHDMSSSVTAHACYMDRQLSHDLHMSSLRCRYIPKLFSISLPTGAKGKNPIRFCEMLIGRAERDAGNKWTLIGRL